jgi:hypothetical protein
VKEVTSADGAVRVHERDPMKVFAMRSCRAE